MIEYSRSATQLTQAPVSENASPALQARSEILNPKDVDVELIVDR